MVLPLVVLGVASVLAGFLVNPTTNLGIVPMHWMTEFLGHGPVHLEAETFNRWLAAASSVVAVAGILLAYLMYYRRRRLPQLLSEALEPVRVLLSRKYYMDELYEDFLVRRLFYGGLARATDWVDKSVVDRLVDAVGWSGANVGRVLRQAQTGQLQGYGFAISVGILVIVGIYILFL
jgi:NADH-quinone oxidoreductase subunit L